PTAPGAATLEQRTEHAVGRVNTGDCVGECGAEKAWTVRVDDNAEKTAQCLSHGVVAGTVRVRTARAEAADRAVDELRIQLLQPFAARAETLGGAGTEVLNVNVGAGEQVVEDLAIGGAVEIERDAALVAVVRLEVRRELAALIRAIRIARGTLDFDDVGAQVGEHHPGAGTRDEGALLDDANA